MYKTRNEKEKRETPHEERTQQKAQYLPIQDKAGHAPREAANQRMTAQEEEEKQREEGGAPRNQQQTQKIHTRRSTEMRWDTWPHWENQDNQKQRKRTRQGH